MTHRSASRLAGYLATACSAALLPTAAVQAADAFDDRGDRLEEITVVATQSPRKSFEIPAMVTVLDKEAIDDRVASDVAELFQGIPGVQFDGGPRRTGQVPVVRGLSGAGVLVLFDGARQSFLSGHDGRFFIDPDLLASVEVVRGPSSSLYGSGALGGVLAFETLGASDLLAPEERWGVRLRSAFQSVNDEFLGAGTVFGRAGGFEGLANITYRESGDIALGNDVDLPADNEIVSVLLKGEAALAPGLSVDGSYIRYDDSAIEPNNPQNANRASPGNPTVDKDITSDTGRLRLNFAPDDLALIDFDIVGYYSRAEVEEAELDSPRVVGRTVETVGVRATNRSRLDLTDSANLTLTYGGEYYQDDQDGFDNQTSDNERGGVPDATTDFVGLFAQAEFSYDSPIGEWLFIPGFRWDRFENSAEGPDGFDTDDDEISPKASLSYQPVDWLLLFGSYSEAFRAPTFNEVFADGVHFQIPLGPGVFAPNFFVPNPELEAERSETWEFGGGLTFDHLLARGDRFRVKASYYDSDVNNLIGLEVDMTFSPGCFVPMAGPCTSGTSRNVNTEQADIDGVEVEANYESARFYGLATYSQLDSRDAVSGAPVGIAVPDTVFLDGGVKIYEVDVRLGVRAEFASDVDDVADPAQVRDSFEVFDIYAVFEPEEGLLKGLRLDLAVDNVGDEAFERVAAGAVAPGRNFQAALRYTLSF